MIVWMIMGFSSDMKNCSNHMIPYLSQFCVTSASENIILWQKPESKPKPMNIPFRLWTTTAMTWLFKKKNKRRRTRWSRKGRRYRKKGNRRRREKKTREKREWVALWCHQNLRLYNMEWQYNLCIGFRRTDHSLFKGLRLCPSWDSHRAPPQEQCCYFNPLSKWWEGKGGRGDNNFFLEGGDEEEMEMKWKEMKSTATYIISLTALFRKPSLH